MDKASKALRRSGVFLKNINSGHNDLHMVISDLTEMRSVLKAVMSAQNTLWEDLIKWAHKERNSILKECLLHFFELNTLWSEVQRQFIENLKKFKHQFEVILEGECHIDKSRNNLTACEQKEAKLMKEIRKANNKGTIEDVRALEDKLVESKALIKAAQTEVKGKISEQEAVKMIMLKEGLNNLSDYYLDLSEKSVIIFEAQKRISEGLPDVKDKEIQDIKYSGSEAAKRMVISAKENVLKYKRPPGEGPTAPAYPPPYSLPTTSSPLPYGFQTRINDEPNYSLNSYSSPPRPSYTGFPPGFHQSVSPPCYDLPPREPYENIDAALGGLS